MPISEPAVRRWQPEPLGGRAAPAANAADALEALRRKASEDGYQAGLRAGEQAASGTARRLATLLASGEHALRLLEERVAGEVLDLAVELARRVLRAEVALRREVVLPVAREALGHLAQDARAVQIVAAPQDAELLRAHLAEELARGGWRIAEDPRIEPGGVRIVSSTGDVDATLATRWRRVLASLGRDQEWHEPGA